MADFEWRKTLDQGRSSAGAAAASLSTSAREAAETARQRIGATYGNARDRASTLAADGRTLSATGRDVGARAAKRGKRVVDRALVESRGLIAERPVTAVVIGIAAGAVLGFLANRVAKTRAATPVEDEDADYGG